MSSDHSHLTQKQKMRIVQQLRENSRNNSGVMHGISDRDRIYADENEEKTISIPMREYIGLRRNRDRYNRQYYQEPG